MADPRDAYIRELGRRGLGELFREEGPGSTGTFPLPPLSYNALTAREAARNYLPNRSYGFGISSAKPSNEELFDSYNALIARKADNSYLPIDAYEDIKQGTGPVSRLEDKRAVADAYLRLNALPEDDPVFAESSLDDLSMDIDDLLAVLEKPREATGQDDIEGDAPAIAETTQEDVNVTQEDVNVTQDDIDDGFMAAMDDFLESARDAGPEIPKERTIDEYKKTFSEATGIDISGKIDKSQTLMAFGLALMQNKAGKGFNVSKILKSIGTAGELARPELEKAKERARSDAVAGGKYALEMQSRDEAKLAAAKDAAMERSKFWVYRKGAPGDAIGGFDQGEFVDLNKYELNKLIMNPDFKKQFEFINAKDYIDVLKESAKGLDLGDQWGDTRMISMIGGDIDDVGPEFQALVAIANQNYKGEPPAPFKLVETPETVVRKLIGIQNQVNSEAENFGKLLENIGTGVTIPDQILSSITQTFRAVGFDGKGPSAIADAKRMLSNISIDNATEILRESGKTLSDRDRDLVRKRVGEINWRNADLKLTQRQLKDIYTLTVVIPQQKIDSSISWLEENADINISPALRNTTAKATQEEVDKINSLNGLNLTLDDFK